MKVNLYCTLASLLLAAVAVTAQEHRPAQARQNPPPVSLHTNLVEQHNFDGLGQNFGMTDSSIPPDPAAAVGLTQVVEAVNSSLAVFNKGTGEIVYGPVPLNRIFSSMDTPCATYNDGQPVVRFDQLASRWVIGQLVSHGPPYYFCVAVSTTSDALGDYNLYSIALSDTPDSPRLALWPDAYYVTFNMLSGGTFLYSNVCALDRASLLSGQTPRGPLCRQTTQQYASLLPADLDGSTLPPAGSPNYLFSLGHNAVEFWTYAVNFDSGTATLSGPLPIAVQPFSPACSAINCVDQKGTTQRLTALSDRLMYRAAYRNFGDHESVTVDHTIIFALRYAALRWYELRDLHSGMPTIFQQATYIPTFIHRWMGSVAMDRLGDLAAVYNESSAGLHPSLFFTSRLSTDPLGRLGTDNLLLAGTGSQTQGHQWGYVTPLMIDPGDDCTFWAAGEYLRSDGTNNWSTRLASFSLAPCASSNPGIQITSAPPFGQNGNISGTVSNIDPAHYHDYQVASELFIPGFGAWSKQSCEFQFADIDSNGNWSVWVGIGGAGDYTATKYFASLVSRGTSATCQMGYDGLSFDLETKAIARAAYQRPNPLQPLSFNGKLWEVTDNTALAIYPGPCSFSKDNAFVDNEGNLHLAVTQDSRGWHCAQVAFPPQLQQGQQAQQVFGYGEYRFSLVSPVDSFDPNIVIGLYTWHDDPAYAPYQNGQFFQAYSPWTNNPFANSQGAGIVPSHSELDVEFSRWGILGGPNAQFVVQPFTNQNARHQFNLAPGYNQSVAIIDWFPDGISFRLEDPNGGIIEQYSYPGAVPPPGDAGGWLGPVPSFQQVRLNAWIYATPQVGGEVVVNSVDFRPYSN